MAVNTRDRRFSLLAFGKPVPWMMPNADGTIGTQDRAMFAYLYHGISIGAVAIMAPYYYFKLMQGSGY